jgi:hypothetical protein
MKINRRNLLKSVAIAAPILTVAAISEIASAAPNGTRPTVLSNLSVVATSSTQMRVTGNLATLTGSGLAGMKIDIYSVSQATFTRWSTVYTDNSGNFTSTTSKVPVGNKIQIVVDGNGAYSQPFLTFNRP